MSSFVRKALRADPLKILDFKQRRAYRQHLAKLKQKERELEALPTVIAEGFCDNGLTKPACGKCPNCCKYMQKVGEPKMPTESGDKDAA